MTPINVAVIEDDPPTSAQLKGWIEAARPGTVVHQWFTRDEAERAIAQHHYAAVVLDIELGRERNAGVALINAIHKRAATPVLVVSGMPAELYRGVMKALDAWDYLQKSHFSEADFVETFLDILRQAPQASTVPAAAPELSIDPLRQGAPLWRGQRLNLPITAQRVLALLAERRGDVVSYEDIYRVIKSGHNRDNVRKHVSAIREAFRELEPGFDGIENVPMRGFRLLKA